VTSVFEPTATLGGEYRVEQAFESAGATPKRTRRRRRSTAQRTRSLVFVQVPLENSGRPVFRIRFAPDWIRTAQDRLAKLGELRGNWDGQGAKKPTPKSLEIARRVLARLIDFDCAPERVVAAVRGGISFYFVGRELTSGGAHVVYASYECGNSGQLLRVHGDRSKGAVDVVAVNPLDDELGESIQLTQDHLLG